MATEQITNLPWLLERVAKRLEDLATRIREAEREGATFSHDQKAIKETVLHSLATSNSQDSSNATEELLKLLRKTAT